MHNHHLHVYIRSYNTEIRTSINFAIGYALILQLDIHRLVEANMHYANRQYADADPESVNTHIGLLYSVKRTVYLF